MFRFQFAVFPSCTLHEDIAKLLSPTLRFTTDVEFLVGKNETSVRAHMAIVAARCDWLRERILVAKNIKLEVSDVDGDVQVKLPEVEPESFSLWYVQKKSKVLSKHLQLFTKTKASFLNYVSLLNRVLVASKMLTKSNEIANLGT